MVDMFFISSNYIKCSILLVILLLVGIEAIAFVVDLLSLSPRLLALLTPHLPHHLWSMLPHHLRPMLSHLPHHLRSLLPHLPHHLRPLLPHHMMPLLTHHTMLPHHLRRHSSVSHVRLSRQTLSPRVHLRLPLRPEVSLLAEHSHPPLPVVGVLVPVDAEHGGRIGVSRAYDRRSVRSEGHLSPGGSGAVPDFDGEVLLSPPDEQPVQHVVEPLRVADALLEGAVGVLVPEAVRPLSASVHAGGAHAGGLHVSVGSEGVPATEAYIRRRLSLLTDVSVLGGSSVVDDGPLVSALLHHDRLPRGDRAQSVLEVLPHVAEVRRQLRVPRVDPDHPFHALRSVAFSPEEDAVGSTVRQEVLDEQVSLHVVDVYELSAHPSAVTGRHGQCLRRLLQLVALALVGGPAHIAALSLRPVVADHGVVVEAAVLLHLRAGARVGDPEGGVPPAVGGHVELVVVDHAGLVVLLQLLGDRTLLSIIISSFLTESCASHQTQAKQRQQTPRPHGQRRRWDEKSLISTHTLTKIDEVL